MIEPIEHLLRRWAEGYRLAGGEHSYFPIVLDLAAREIEQLRAPSPDAGAIPLCHDGLDY